MEIYAYHSEGKIFKYSLEALPEKGQLEETLLTVDSINLQNIEEALREILDNTEGV